MVKKSKVWLGAWSSSLIFHALLLAILSVIGISQVAEVKVDSKPIELDLINIGGGGGSPAPASVMEAIKELPPVEAVKPIEQIAPTLTETNDNSIVTEHKEATPSSGVHSAAGGTGGGGEGTGTGTGSGSGVGPGSGSGEGGGDGDGNFYRPKVLSAPKPGYPESAKKQGHEGTVVVGLTISVDGTVSSAWVNSSSGYGELDNAAVNAVYSWQFVPAKRGKTPIESTTSVPVEFDIRRAR